MHMESAAKRVGQTPEAMAQVRFMGLAETFAAHPENET